MHEPESSDTKICPDCTTVNALQNLRCIKCGTSLLHVQPEPFWKDGGLNHKGLGSTGELFYEIFVTLVFLLTIPLGIFTSRWYFVFSIILLIYMLKNNYLSFLMQLLSRYYRR